MGVAGTIPLRRRTLWLPGVVALACAVLVTAPPVGASPVVSSPGSPAPLTTVLKPPYAGTGYTVSAGLPFQCASLFLRPSSFNLTTGVARMGLNASARYCGGGSTLQSSANASLGAILNLTFHLTKGHHSVAFGWNVVGIISVQVASRNAARPVGACTYLDFSQTTLTGPGTIMGNPTTTVPASWATSPASNPICASGNSAVTVRGHGVFSNFFNASFRAGTYTLQIVFDIQEGSYVSVPGRAHVDVNVGSGGAYAQLAWVRIT